MKVKNLRVLSQMGGSRLTAQVDDEELFFDYQGAVPDSPTLGDTFLLSCLFSAMHKKQNITLDDSAPVSASLLESLTQYQQIFSAWSEEYTPIQIEAGNVCSEMPKGTGTGVLFSGGADANYTFLKHRETASKLIFCIGVQLRRNETERVEKAIEGCKTYARLYGQELIIVKSNVREVLPTINGRYAHGALYIGMGLAYGFEKLLISASHTALELFPWGSHPLTDPMLSNEATSVIHYGMTSRTEKIRYLSEHEHVLDSLRVCNVSEDFNCGSCEKCLRTAAALELLQYHSASLPPLDYKQARKVRVYNANEYGYWQDIKIMADKYQNEKIAALASRITRRYEFKSALKQLARSIT